MRTCREGLGWLDGVHLQHSAGVTLPYFQGKISFHCLHLTIFS
uniref:Uncharacterized protein n=1 Tax=Anguilla anguilla TaxID=7936 RepID=A0A0E9WFG1_ANGAN